MRRYTPAELNDIILRIMSGPGLWAPWRPSLPPAMGPTFHVYMRYSDLVEGNYELEGRYWEGLRHVPVMNSLRTLALINGILSEHRADGPVVNSLLNEKFLPARLRASLAERRPDGALAPVFNVVGCIQLAHHLVAYGDATAGSSGQEFDRLGELVLLANDCIQPGPSFRSEKPGSLDLLVSMLPMWDVSNPRDLAHALSRMYTILTEILPGADPEIRRLASRLGMDTSAIRVGQLRLDDFVSAVFGLYAYGRRMATEEPGCAVFNPRRIFAKIGFPPEILEKLVEDHGLTVPELRERLSGGSPLTRERFAEEVRRRSFLTEGLNHFRKFPLLRLGDDSVLIFHLQFLVELLTSGTYWGIFDGLRRNQRETFRELWGRAFELYVLGLLREFYPRKSPILAVAGERGAGRADALLDFVDDVFVLEAKASLLTEQAKRGGNEAAFVKDFNLKFVRNGRGDPKGIMQLAAACKDVEHGEIRTAKMPARIYPVLVSAEPGVETAFFNTYANEVFQREAAPGPRIQPITIMSISELEGVLPYFVENEFSWGEVLTSRFRGTEVGPYSVHQAVHDLLRLKGLHSRRNEVIRSRFDRVWATIMAKYKPGAG